VKKLKLGYSPDKNDEDKLKVLKIDIFLD